MHPYFDRVREVLRPSTLPDPAEKDRVFVDAVAAAGFAAAEYPDLAVTWGEDPDRPEKVINSAGVVLDSETRGHRVALVVSTCSLGRDAALPANRSRDAPGYRYRIPSPPQEPRRIRIFMTTGNAACPRVNA